MRRVTRVGALALASGLLVAPWAMHAALAATVTITPADGTRVSGAGQSIHASISGQNGNVQSWTVQIAKDATSPQFTNLSGCTTTATAVDCKWDTTKVLGTTAIAPNGKYLVKVSARDSGNSPLGPGPQTYTNQVALFVQNAPAAPANLAVVKDEAAARINVSWSPNAEPDIAEYQLDERLPDGAVKQWHVTPPCQGSSCTFSRQYTVGGPYQYSVTAKRSATNPDGSATTLASPATGPKQTTVADPNPTTTTTTTRPPTPTTGGGGTTTTRGGSGGGGNGGGGDNGGNADPNNSSGGVVVNGFRVVGVAGGNPGTQSSTFHSSGKVVTLGPDETPENDPGFNETLPFKKPDKQQPDNIAQAIANIPTRVFTDDSTRRTALQITAFGLLIFVLAMQIRYITRRAAEAA